MKYWQAFALLPTLDKDQEKLLEQWNKVPLDAAALKLIERSRGSREYLHRGAKLPRCDWSLDYEDGLFLRLPYLPKARTLAAPGRPACAARIRARSLEGGVGRRDRPAELGRHVEAEPLFVQRWVGRAIETIGDRGRGPLPAGVETGPPRGRDRRPGCAAGRGRRSSKWSSRRSKSVLMWLIRELKEAERRKEGSWQDVWNDIRCDPRSPATRTSRTGTLDPIRQDVRAGRSRWLEDLLPFYDRAGAR